MLSLGRFSTTRDGTGLQRSPCVAITGRLLPWDCFVVHFICMLLDCVVPMAAAEAPMSAVESSARRILPPQQNRTQRLSPHAPP